ncbi:MAG: type II toxin-antitoxin system VapC family toxin [Pseudomonadota bacterium]
MNLDDIQSGSFCVADTNVLLYAEQGMSKQCQRFLRRSATGELIIQLPQTIWHELCHKLMLAEAMMTGKGTGPGPASKLARRPDIIKGLGLYREKLRSLVQLGLGFEPCTREDLFETAFNYQKKYGLLTNDSLILAAAVRLKADALVTAAETFRDVKEILVAMPTDLMH